MKNSIRFNVGSGIDATEVLRLDKEGFHYKGELIQDAGKCYELFNDWINKARQETKADLFGDVAAFHQKFGLEATDGPDFPNEEIWKLKNVHMQEELDEIRAACLIGDLEQYFDGLIDLVYVALGAAYFANLPFNEGFRRVHEANMKKVRATRAEDSKRGSTFDIIKPAGWQAPALDDLIRKEKA